MATLSISAFALKFLSKELDQCRIIQRIYREYHQSLKTIFSVICECCAFRRTQHPVGSQCLTVCCKNAEEQQTLQWLCSQEIQNQSTIENVVAYAQKLVNVCCLWSPHWSSKIRSCAMTNQVLFVDQCNAKMFQNFRNQFHNFIIRQFHYFWFFGFTTVENMHIIAFILSIRTETAL